MQQQLYPSDLAEDSLESLLNRHSRRSQAIYLSAVALLLGALAMLPLVRVGISVRGQGIVRPTTEKHEVRARTSGFAEVLAVDENERVDKGQMLVRLRTSPLRVREALVHAQIEQTEAFVHDLALLTRPGGEPASLRPEEFRSPKYRQERDQLINELGEMEIQEEKALREAERARALARRSLIPQREAEDREFELSQVHAGRALLVERYQSAWQSDLATARMELRQHVSAQDQIDEESSLYTVEAPVTGTVETLASISTGSYVQAGEQLAVISPTTELVAEVYVAPRDIGLVRPGTPVRVLIDAFNYNDWGHVPGRVTRISDDYVMSADRPMFRVEITLDRTYLSLRNGFRGELKKGMTLSARFMVAERTLFQLLRDDVNDWLNPAGPA